MKKKGCRRLNISKGRIDTGKDPGQITLFTGLFYILFLGIILSAQLQIEMYRTSGSYLEDALAAAGLASAVIDVREYGYSHTVRIRQEAGAYEIYREALKENLGLDENWNCANKKLISGQVRVENYTIYNVAGGEVTICRLDRGSEERTSGRLGKVCAPNGQIIEHTGIYSEISYPVQGILGIDVEAHKGKLVDVVGE